MEIFDCRMQNRPLVELVQTARVGIPDETPEKWSVIWLRGEVKDGDPSSNSALADDTEFWFDVMRGV
jgi:hypothetical protein